MNRRVSINEPFNRKFFTSTLPFGNVKSPSVPTEIDVPFGIASQRSFAAPSDQNAAAGAYGIRPAAGWLGFCALTQPVSDKSAGTGEPDEPPAPPSTILYKAPPFRSTTYNSPSLPWPNDEIPRLVSSSCSFV